MTGLFFLPITGPMKTSLYKFSRNKIVVVFTVSLVICLGCSERTKDIQEGVDSSASKVVANRPANQGSDTKLHNDATKRRNEQDTNYVVPGINFKPPVDDALADGWLTEKLASTASDQLKKIAYLFQATDKPSLAVLKKIVEPDISFTALRPANVETVFADAAFTIRRANKEQAKPLSGMNEFDKQVNELLDFVTNPSQIDSKVKLFKINQEGERLFTSAYMQTWGTSDEGSLQSNSTWNCVWNIRGANLTLQSLEVADYLEVVGSRTENGDGPMFADCTEAVLGDTPSFRDQLIPSMDQWLHVIEIQYHINIGGWEGLSIADVNGDGLDDLYVSQPGGLPNRMFVQNGDGTCRDTSRESGTDWLNQTHGSVFGDIDNDGDQDLVVGVHDGLLVMSNDGSGKFTVRRGLLLPAAVPYSLTLVDYDQDGDLDLYACCYDRRSGVNRERIFAKAIPYHDANNGGRNVLLRNDSTPAESAWQFRYVTRQSGLDMNNRRFSYSASWEDYDNDGDMDLYVANDFGRNNLFRNDNGKFNDVASEAGVEDVSAGMSITWGDYNNDGWMDIYVSNMFSSAGNRIAFQRKFHSGAADETKKFFQRHARGNSLFENSKDGTFRDVSVEADVTMGRWAWGSRFIDINNDGWRDLLVCNGFLTQHKADDL